MGREKDVMNGLVYHAFDMTNGKAYVGQTTLSMNERRKQHLRSKLHCPFINALKKRPEKFMWSVLVTDLQTQQDLDAAELYWGEHFDCLVPNGYNLKLGNGRGKCSDETRQKMKHPKTEEHRAKMRKPKSPEQIENMKRAQQARSKQISEQAKLFWKRKRGEL